MGWFEIISAVVSAYMEREKAGKDEQRARDVIKAINDLIWNMRDVIAGLLEEQLLNELNGKYIGAIAEFKDYKGDKFAIFQLSAFTNEELYGPLIGLVQRNTELIFVRKIVKLLTLVIFLRATILSEIKHSHNQNNDEELREQFDRLKECMSRVINEQKKLVITKENEWHECEGYAMPVPSPICFPVPDPSGSGRTPLPHCCSHWAHYVDELKILMEDQKDMSKIEEAITFLNNNHIII